MAGMKVRALVPGDLSGAGLLGLARDGSGQVGMAPRGSAGLSPTAAWARASQDLWGLCGSVVLEADQPVAMALVSPGLNIPVGHPLEQWARSPEAAYLVGLYCTRPADGCQLTRLLCQGLAKNLVGQAGAVEAAGRAVHGLGPALAARAVSTAEATGSGAPRLDWLLDAGFTATGEVAKGWHRARMDLTSSVRWRPDLNRAWELLGGLVPRPVRPEPTGRGSREAGWARPQRVQVARVG